MLVSAVMNQQPAFAEYERFVIDEDELYVINSMNIKGTVLVPKGFPKTAALIEKLGYPVKLMYTNEFRLIDASLTCLSLRF
jgi:dimethylargininase